MSELFICIVLYVDLYVSLCARVITCLCIVAPSVIFYPQACHAVIGEKSRFLYFIVFIFLHQLPKKEKWLMVSISSVFLGGTGSLVTTEEEFEENNL